MAIPQRLRTLARPLLPYALLGLVYLAMLLAATNRFGPPSDQPVYWSGWADQGQYLRSAQAFAALRLDPAEHWYSLLYPLIAAPFTVLTPALPFALIGCLCVVAAFAGFRRVAASFGIALWPAFVIFTLTTLVEPHIAANWVEPWTTTLSAALIWLALGQLVPLLTDREAGRSSTGLAMLGCLLALAPLARPADAVVSLVLAIFLVKPMLVDRRNWRGIAALIAGAAPPLAGYAALHLAIYGPHPSDYMRLSAAYGFNLGWLPWKAYLILVDPMPWFPSGTALLSVCPWLILGMAALLMSAIAPSRQRLAALCLLIVSAAYVALVLSYGDLLPTGFWRFNNVHYLKWLFPLFGLFAVIFVRDIRRSPAIGSVSLAILFLLTCLRLNPVAAADGTPARLLLFAPPSPDSPAIPTAQSVIVDRIGQLRNFFDYRQMPAGDSIIAVAAKRDFAGGERWIGQLPGPRVPWPANVQGGYAMEPLPGPWPREPVARYRPQLGLGPPCWLLSFVCESAARPGDARPPRRPG